MSLTEEKVVVLTMLVTIIIPIYNVQDYILKCLESVANQSYNGLIECVLVDDCGQDRSIEIAERFIRDNKSPVKFRLVHHEKNRGLSAARNTGIREATGDWLYFLDSDDWIAADCLEIMIQKVLANPDLDMVLGNYTYIGKQLDLKFAPAGLYSEDLISMAHFGLIYPMVPNKLIKKSLILDNNLYFEEGLLHEDVLWTIQAACYMKKIESIDDKTYNYVIHTGSISTTDSFDFHYKHFSKVKLLSIQFAFSRGFQQNVDLYKCCTDDLYQYIIEPVYQHREDLAKVYYNNLRIAPFWSLPFIIRNRRCWKEVLISLNRYLPKWLGFSYLKLVLSTKSREKTICNA